MVSQISLYLSFRYRVLRSNRKYMTSPLLAVCNRYCIVRVLNRKFITYYVYTDFTSGYAIVQCRTEFRKAARVLSRSSRSPGKSLHAHSRFELARHRGTAREIRGVCVLEPRRASVERREDRVIAMPFSDSVSLARVTTSSFAK